jgi:hypothetical protein
MNIQKSLRHGRSPSLKRRRAITWLGAAALIDSALMTLQQMGAIRHLPDPPGFHSDEVVGSRAAYIFGAPDAPINALSTSVTLVLAGDVRCSTCSSAPPSSPPPPARSSISAT